METENRVMIEIILNRFYSWGITTIFIIPGSHIDEILNQIIDDGRFKIIVASHEQGAGYMADGYARVSQRPGVVITINGPGASNLITPAITARVDHSPVIFLTGDAPINRRNFGSFQSSDITSSNTNAIFQKAISNSFDVIDCDTLYSSINFMQNQFILNCFNPMHINLPTDVVRRKIKWRKENSKCIHNYRNIQDLSYFPSSPGGKAAILVGEEVRNPGMLKAIAEFSEQHMIPVAVTLAAKNIQPFLIEELYLGIFGYSGCPRANKAILDPELETLIVFEAILDERNTLSWNKNFFHDNRKIIRFSAYKDTCRDYPNTVSEVYGDTFKGIMLLKNMWEVPIQNYQEETKWRKNWIFSLQMAERIPTNKKETKLREKGMDMSEVVITMNNEFSNNTKFFLDSGDHRIYGATFWEVKSSHTFFTAAKTAPMGWAIAAAIGASFACKDTQICVLTGDGCMQMHGMELAVAARYNCQVVFMVSNNTSYGRIAQRYKDKKSIYNETIANLPSISWTNFAESLGVSARKVTSIDELLKAISEAKESKGPFLIEMIISPEQKVPYSESIFSSNI